MMGRGSRVGPSRIAEKLGHDSTSVMASDPEVLARTRPGGEYHFIPACAALTLSLLSRRLLCGGLDADPEKMLSHLTH